MPGLRWVRRTRPILGALLLSAAVATPAAAATAPTPGAVRVVADQHYGTPASTANALDVYEPAGARSDPMLVVVHGGRLTRGDKGDLAEVSGKLAAAGYVVFDVNYSLDDDGPAYPRDVDELSAALGWALAHARGYGADPRRVGLVGESAGAYLVSMVALTTHAHGLPGVRAVVSLSGPMQLATYPGLGTTGCGSGCTPATVDELRGLFGCAASGCPAGLLAAASPEDKVGPRGPAFLLANSTDELIPLDQATGMASALRAAGDRVDLVVLPGTLHAGAYADQIGARVLAFLSATVAPPAHRSRPVWPVVGAAASAAALVVAVVVAATVARRRRRSRPAYL